MKRILHNFDAFVSAILLIFMTLLTFMNVISRYVLHASISFTDELTSSLFVFLSLLGASVAAKRGSHLGLSALTDIFPMKAQKYIKFTGYVLGAVFCAIIAYYSFFMVKHEYDIGQTSPGLRVPECIYGSFVLVGLTVLCFRFAEGAIKAVFQKEKDK